MSLQAILSKIEEDAKNKVKSILDAAEKEKNSALEEHRKMLTERFHQQKEKLMSSMEESRRRREFHVQREAQRRILNARRSMMDAAIDDAVESLAAADDRKYLSMIAHLLHGCDLKGDVQVIISPADRSRITQSFLKEHSSADRKFILSEETHGSRGGVIMRKGDISQNGTFPMIAELAHEELIMKLSELIPMEEK
jgi:vacuolar-type H+-ATPase subunit E/Vma4